MTSLPIEIDEACEIVTICDVAYTFEFFKFFGADKHPANEYFQIVNKDGLVTVEKSIIDTPRFKVALRVDDAGPN